MYRAVNKEINIFWIILASKFQSFLYIQFHFYSFKAACFAHKSVDIQYEQRTERL